MKAMMKSVILAAGVVGLSSVPAWAGGLNVQPGLWQMTTKMTMKGTPFAMPPRTNTVKQCLSKDQAEHPWKNMQANRDKDCKFSDLKITGSSASWKMRCTNGTQGEGVYVFDGPASMHGHMDLNMKTPQGTIKMHAESSGHRIGSCAAGSGGN